MRKEDILNWVKTQIRSKKTVATVKITSDGVELPCLENEESFLKTLGKMEFQGIVKPCCYITESTYYNPDKDEIYCFSDESCTLQVIYSIL